MYWTPLEDLPPLHTEYSEELRAELELELRVVELGDAEHCLAVQMARLTRGLDYIWL